MADTHVPDRRRMLHPGLLPALREAKPDYILHAGDIILPEVIRELEEIALVIPVKGNRDIWFLPHLSMVKWIAVHGIQIALTHGHAEFWGYLLNKVRMMFRKYDLNWFLPWLMAVGDGADVIVFGHTHRALNEARNGVLLFNPGSVNVPVRQGGPLSFGMLELGDGTIKGEIIPLD